MAVNKFQFCHTKSVNGPDMFLGLVQAGATQAIKAGELCVFNETTNYWVPVDAVADAYSYSLALSAEEQKSTGRGELTGSRYMKFYSLSPDDVFEFELAAAQSLVIGDPFTLTASDSQKLTAGAGALAVAINVGDDHYPQEEDTTIRNQSYARVTFNPACTWWGFRKSQIVRPGRKVISTGTATLLENQMYNTLIIITSAATITLPAVKPGMDVIFLSDNAEASNVDPNSADQIRLKGALLTAGNKLTNNSAAGDSVQLITESADGFCATILYGNWTDGS